MAALTKLSEEADALYAKIIEQASASEEGVRKVFYQEDFQKLAPELSTSLSNLMGLIQELTSHSLLRTSRLNKVLCWSTRPREAAKAISLLNENEKIVYTYVEDAHQKGIWVKDVKKRSNVDGAAVDKAIKKLESTRLIKNVRNIRSPVQKTYMLFHLAPSDDITGGSFFDSGDLDESLVEELSNVIVYRVRAESWIDAKAKRVKRERSPVVVDDEEEAADAGAKSKKRKRSSKTGDIEDSVSPAAHRKQRRSSRHDPETDAGQPTLIQVAYPAYSRAYPSTEQLHEFVTTGKIISTSKAQQITVAEIQSLIDVLVWDDKLEKVGNGYRTVRGINLNKHGFPPDDEDDDEEEEEQQWWKGNGLTQVPCGRCPVFDLCGEGGPINAGNCEYFQEWLGNKE